MLNNVVKRNGNVVKFDKNKIKRAILKAMKNGSGIVDQHVANSISNEIKEISKQVGLLTIEQIETMVFEKLVHHGHELTGKAYEGYRAIQQFKRENKNNKLIDSVIGLVELTNEEVMSENSNKQAELVSTQRDLIAGEVSKIIAKNYMIPPHIVQANDIGAIKIHE